MTEAIMTGGARTLQRAEVRELHVEASETSKGGRRLVEILGQVPIRHRRQARAERHDGIHVRQNACGPAGAGRPLNVTGIRAICVFFESPLQRARVRGGQPR